MFKNIFSGFFLQKEKNAENLLLFHLIQNRDDNNNNSNNSNNTHHKNRHSQC